MEDVIIETLLQDEESNIDYEETLHLSKLPEDILVKIERGEYL